MLSTHWCQGNVAE